MKGLYYEYRIDSTNFGKNMFVIFLYIGFVLTIGTLLFCWLYTALLKWKDNKKREISKEINENNSPSKTNYIKLHLVLFFSGYYMWILLQVGNFPSQRIRLVLYRYIYGVKIKKNSVIYGRAEIRDPHKLFIDEGCAIGSSVILDARNGIRIGKNVNFSSDVSLWTEQHDYNSPIFELSSKTNGITIEDYVWLGARVTVLPNVVIREGAVVAAGSVVVKDVEPYSLYAGIPAKKIGERKVKDLSYSPGEYYVSFF